MIPYTPTPQPPGTAYFAVPESYSLWGSTDVAIQYWNWTGAMGTIVQVLMLIALIILGFHIIKHFVDNFTGDDAQK